MDDKKPAFTLDIGENGNKDDGIIIRKNGCETYYALSKRNTILCNALERINQKCDSYGQPENNFGIVADLWSDYLECDIFPADVGFMMIAFKLARAKSTTTEDTLVDIAGYAACIAELPM